MNTGWSIFKHIMIVASAVLLACLGVMLLYGFIHGDIEAFRAVLKITAVVCVLAWLYEKWVLLRQA